MKLFYIFIIILLSGCASLVPSAEKLEAEPTCKAWKETLFGTKAVADVEDETAIYSHSCGITGCSKVYAKYKNQNDIYTSNSGLIKLETKMASFDGSQFILDSSVVKSPPFEIKDKQADYQISAMGKTTNTTIYYNKACNKRQAALAVAVLFSK